MRGLLVAVGVIAATVGCAHSIPRERPWVNIRPGQADDFCAGPPDLDHPVPHAHTVFFFDLLGAPIGERDVLTVTLNGGRTVTFREHDGLTFAVHFPAGLGRHLVEARWLDKNGGTRAVSTTYLNLWTCPSK